MLEATLCFLVREGPTAEILLGLKKVGFGQGKYGGVGGKIEEGEAPAHAAVRELYEETGIRAREADLRRVGHLTFLFPFKPRWSQVVHVYVSRTWEGQAQDSREIEPFWFPEKEIPYDQMWSDCRHWLPRVLAGKLTRARFVFGPDNEEVSEYEIEPWCAIGGRKP